ncbi:uncharacterized protein LOC126617062 [Malus sylvestris]|uniref:uncharacterized protein LOC126617062 n=1 Tax=Malus sylvestris TaxID=3752 RepID=UPI0021AD312B|nr:uncharacterized protein LOC126617062 [Malus sylvestris]
MSGYGGSEKKKKVEGSSEDEIDEEMATVLMKNARALGIIQNAVFDQIFPRIANAETTKMAWDLLYGEYHGGDQVRSVKLQNLRCEFEYARMCDNEPLSGYLTRLNEFINQMKTFGEILPNERFVQKVLISLSKPYDHICLVIENTKCLETVELQEVVAILKSQEQQFDLHTVDTIERVFASLSKNSKEQNKSSAHSGPSIVQKNWNPKGKKWESKSKFQQKPFENIYQNVNSTQPMSQEVTKPQCKVCSKYHFGDCRHKGKPKCFISDKFGHSARQCIAGKMLLVDMKTNVAGKVQMPIGDLANVAGIGSLVIDTSKGRKYVREMMNLLGLKENLLSVG